MTETGQVRPSVNLERQPESEIVNFRADPKLLAWIDDEARQRNTSRSAIIREIVATALDPENRRGFNYGQYLKARDAKKVAMGIFIVFLAVGVWTIGLLW